MLWMHLITVMGTRRENIILCSDGGDGRLFWWKIKHIIPELSICSPEKNDVPFALIVSHTNQTQHLHTINSKTDTTNITSMAQIYERLIIPQRMTVTHQKSSARTQLRADFFICTMGAQKLLKQAQTYSVSAQDISLFCDRGHVVVIIANYTQPWHSSVKFLILKVHLEKDLAQFLNRKVSEVAHFQVIKKMME